jgi:hypothetical protein
VAVTHEGLLRLLCAGAGFSGYLFFFARGLRELGLPSVVIEGRPGLDGGVVERSEQRHLVTTAA